MQPSSTSFFLPLFLTSLEHSSVCPSLFFCIFSLSIREMRNKCTLHSYLCSRDRTVFTLKPPPGRGGILQEIRNRGGEDKEVRWRYKREQKRRGGDLSVRAVVEPVRLERAFQLVACPNSGLSHLLSAHSICWERYSSHLITNRRLSLFAVGQVMRSDIRKKLSKTLLV